MENVKQHLTIQTDSSSENAYWHIEYNKQGRRHCGAVFMVIVLCIIINEDFKKKVFSKTLVNKLNGN